MLALAAGLAMLTASAPLDVPLFGKPEWLPEGVWERSTISQRALLLSRRADPSGDDSKFTGNEDYPRLAREALARYYRKTAPQSPPPGLDRLTVQLEVFAWQNASFRIDLFFAQKPGFVPLDSSFVMAHRMWMRRSGKVIRQEPVYRTTNVEEGRAESSVPASRRGFYPGPDAFAAELARIDAALRAAGSVGAPALDVRRGIEDLARYQAAIVETKAAFRIAIDSQKAGPEVFGPYRHLTFEMDKATGRLSPLQVKSYRPPALQ